MVCSIFVTLDFARRGYVYAAPLSVVVAVNFASISTATVFLSNIYDGRNNGFGGPNSWLPSPYKINNLPSTCVGVAPMGIDPTPTQCTTFTRCVFGTFTRAMWTWFPSFSLSITGTVLSRKSKNADDWLLWSSHDVVCRFFSPWPQELVMIQRCSERARVPLSLSLLLLDEELWKFCFHLPPSEGLILHLSPEEAPILLEWPCFVVVARRFVGVHQTQFM